MQTPRCRIRPTDCHIQQPPEWGIHQVPQILLILFLQEHKPLWCGTPTLCTMKERVSSYSDHENCPKNHLHTACSHLGAAAAPSDTPQQFPSHKAVLGTQVHLLMSLLTAFAPQLSQRDAASVP